METNRIVGINKLFLWISRRQFNAVFVLDCSIADHQTMSVSHVALAGPFHSKFEANFSMLWLCMTFKRIWQGVSFARRQSRLTCGTQPIEQIHEQKRFVDRTIATKCACLFTFACAKKDIKQSGFLVLKYIFARKSTSARYGNCVLFVRNIVILNALLSLSR